MNIENIIILSVCLIAIAAASYYFYTKCNSQQTTIDVLTKRCDELERRLKPVPLHSELAAVYQRNRQRSPQSPQTTSQIFNPSEPCGTSLCDLQPVVIPTNEYLIEDIVDEEVNSVLGAEQHKTRKHKE